MLTRAAMAPIHISRLGFLHPLFCLHCSILFNFGTSLINIGVSVLSVHDWSIWDCFKQSLIFLLNASAVSINTIQCQQFQQYQHCQQYIQCQTYTYKKYTLVKYSETLELERVVGGEGGHVGGKSNVCGQQWSQHNCTQRNTVQTQCYICSTQLNSAQHGADMHNFI